jgi:hypothetical protein
MQSVSNRFLILFAVSVFGGLLTAIAHAAFVEPTAGVRMVMLPSVFSLAMLFGGGAGIIISPLVIWSLGHKNLFIAIPAIYTFSIALIILLDVLQFRFAIVIGFVLTILMLTVYRFLGE